MFSGLAPVEAASRGFIWWEIGVMHTRQLGHKKIKPIVQCIVMA